MVLSSHQYRSVTWRRAVRCPRSARPANIFSKANVPDTLRTLGTICTSTTALVESTVQPTQLPTKMNSLHQKSRFPANVQNVCSSLLIEFMGFTAPRTPTNGVTFIGGSTGAHGNHIVSILNYRCQQRRRKSCRCSPDKTIWCLSSRNTGGSILACRLKRPKPISHISDAFSIIANNKAVHRSRWAPETNVTHQRERV